MAAVTTPAAAPGPRSAAAPAPPAWVRPVFRTLAFAEAVSWAALLVAMYFKWIVADDPNAGAEGGVPIAGPVHGGVFVAYVLISFVAWRVYAWSPKVLLLSLVSAVPPFATVLFEVLADRRGLLGAPPRDPSTT